MPDNPTSVVMGHPTLSTARALVQLGKPFWEVGLSLWPCVVGQLGISRLTLVSDGL